MNNEKNSLNINLINRAAPEISKLRRSFYQKFNPDYKKTPKSQHQTQGIYIRNVSKRPKSPFRKYEKAALESSTNLWGNYSNTSRLNKCNSSSNSCLYSSTNGSLSNIQLARRIPVNKNLIYDQHYKHVNNFEDLVIACMDSNQVAKDNNLIFYKKKYLLNLTGGNNSSELHVNNNIKVRNTNARSSLMKRSFSQSDIYSYSNEKTNEKGERDESRKESIKENSNNMVQEFLSSLMKESLVLRQRIAEGDDDLEAVKRLEKILQLKQACLKRIRENSDIKTKQHVLSGPNNIESMPFTKKVLINKKGKSENSTKELKSQSLFKE
jgi:hypothetical protein